MNREATNRERQIVEEHFLALIRGDKRGLWPALQRLGLRGLSLPYGLGTRWRNWLFECGYKKTHAVAIPVVSVGNLTLGGTGKTPCVEYIARFYRSLDRRVAVLSRGYGAREGRNDEALVLEENLPDVPHLQGPDRVALAGIAIEELDAEVLVLDDGFQHRRLAARSGHCPHRCRGPLGNRLCVSTRPVARAGRRLAARGCGDVNPLRSDQRQVAGKIASAPGPSGNRQTARRNGASRWAGSTLANRRWPWTHLRAECAGFCGIGNPEAFRGTLRIWARTSSLGEFIPITMHTRAKTSTSQSLERSTSAGRQNRDDAKRPGQDSTGSTWATMNFGPCKFSWR